jgi:hypothetical protein
MVNSGFTLTDGTTTWGDTGSPTYTSYLDGPFSWENENQFNTRWIAGDSLYIINSYKMRRTIKFTLILPSLAALNALEQSLVVGNICTIKAGNGSTDLSMYSGYTMAAITTFNGHLSKVNKEINGITFKAKCEFVTAGNVVN